MKSFFVFSYFHLYLGKLHIFLILYVFTLGRNVPQNLLDFHGYTIKSLWEGNFEVKIK